MHQTFQLLLLYALIFYDFFFSIFLLLKIYYFIILFILYKILIFKYFLFLLFLIQCFINFWEFHLLSTSSSNPSKVCVSSPAPTLRFLSNYRAEFSPYTHGCGTIHCKRTSFQKILLYKIKNVLFGFSPQDHWILILWLAYLSFIPADGRYISLGSFRTKLSTAFADRCIFISWNLMTSLFFLSENCACLPYSL